MTVRIVGPLLAVLLAVSPFIAGAHEYEARHVLSYDFARDGLERLTLTPIGPGPEVTAEGLAMPVRAGKPLDLVGVKTDIEIVGDFDITLDFEFQEWTQPRLGRGVGLALYFYTRKQRAVAELGRSLRTDGKHELTTFAGVSDGHKRRTTARSFEATDEQGSLRVRRRGETVYFEVAEGANGTPFRFLREVEFGGEDISGIRIRVRNTDPEVSAWFVVKQLRISGEQVFPTDGELLDEWMRGVWGIARAVLVVVICGVAIVRSRPAE